MSKSANNDQTVKDYQAEVDVVESGRIVVETGVQVHIQHFIVQYPINFIINNKEK